MSWDAIGAVAELVGAATIIITLIYLAIQAHHNNKLTRAGAVWDSQNSFVAINEMIADGGILSEIVYRTFTDPDSLTAFELHLCHRFFRAVLQRVEAQFALYHNGILDAEVWQLRRTYIRALMNNPLFNECWQLEKGNSMFTKAFIEEIDTAPHHEIAGFMGVNSLDAK